MTPDNASYAIAAYVAAVLIYGGYTLALLRRRRALRDGATRAGGVH